MGSPFYSKLSSSSRTNVYYGQTEWEGLESTAFPQISKDTSAWALAVQGDNRDANYGIAYCLFHLKKYDDAIGYFSKVLMRNQYDAGAHYGRGLCYKEIGQFDKSRREINIADGLYAKDKP